MIINVINKDDDDDEYNDQQFKEAGNVVDTKYYDSSANTTLNKIKEV